MDSNVLRIGIAIAGVLLLAAIYFLGRPRKPGQGRRIGSTEANRADAERIEPTLGAQLERELAGEPTGQPELDLPSRQESDVGPHALRREGLGAGSAGKQGQAQRGNRTQRHEYPLPDKGATMRGKIRRGKP